MSIFEGDERTEVRQWIRELEDVLAEANANGASAVREQRQQEEVLNWLKRLVVQA